MVTTDSDEEKRREITGVYPQSLQDPRMGGSRLAKMADEEEELSTSGHEAEHKPSFWRVLRVFFRKVWDAKEGFREKILRY